MSILTNKQAFNKRHGNPKGEANSKKEVSKKSGIPYSVLDSVVKRGEAAFYTNKKSVRPQVKSATQWGYSRMYAFVNKLEDPKKKLNHDIDLCKKTKYKGKCSM
tara:strand:- start:4340 stop:4651 length:312 start_codon:yes stop_codon:yes gene_type:complete